MAQFVVLAFGTKLDGRKRTSNTICYNDESSPACTSAPGKLGSHTFATLPEAVDKRDHLSEVFPDVAYYIAVIID
jgi:hypothetical protein